MVANVARTRNKIALGMSWVRPWPKPQPRKQRQKVARKLNIMILFSRAFTSMILAHCGEHVRLVASLVKLQQLQQTKLSAVPKNAFKSFKSQSPR